MKTVLRYAVLTSITVLCAACASPPPKAPTLNGHNRTPVNSQAYVDLQACKTDLNNTKLLLNETARLADSASSALSQMSAQCAAPRLAPSSAPRAASGAPSFLQSGSGSATPNQVNTVFVLRFPYAGSAVELADKSAIALSEAAKAAQLIVIRGRTDGAKETPGELRVAKARALAVKEYLLAQGVEEQRIRTTYQAVGDHAADNSTEDGRALNRRAEVEVYFTRPVELQLAQDKGTQMAQASANSRIIQLGSAQ